MSNIKNISLLKEKTESEKLNLARKIGDTLVNYDKLTISEIKACEVLIKELVQDAFISVRSLIVDKIKEYPFLSKEISLLIIKDIEKISCPFIEITQSIDNDTWKNIYFSLNLSKKISLSKRKDLDDKIQNLLVSEKNNKITFNIVLHSNYINEDIYDKIIFNNQENSIIINSISERNDLTTNIIKKIYNKVSNIFKVKLEEKLSDLMINNRIENNDFEKILSIINYSHEGEYNNIIENMRHHYNLNEDLLLKILHKGHISFIIHTLSCLSNIEYHHIQYAMKKDLKLTINKLCDIINFSNKFSSELISRIETIRNNNLSY